MSLPFTERLLSQSKISTNSVPFLTVAIPHYKNPRHLAVVLDSIFQQTFDDFEIVVSDDRSPDDSNVVIPPLLQASSCIFRYYAQPSNLGYDGNVRFCLSAALGRYVLMLGNDDALKGPATLEEIAAALRQLDLPEVAFTNFEDWSSGGVERRAYGTRALGAGVDTAIQFFRTFSFVGGLIFDRTLAVQHETDRWDRSIYYQIYLACRMLAAGGRLGALDISAVRKDVRIDGQTVVNYAVKWANAPWSFQPRHTGVESAMRVAVDGVLPYVSEMQRSVATRHILAQALSITYPFWLFEYRRVANWSFAVGIARSLWPGGLLREYSLKWADRLYLWLLYLSVTAAGLLVPASFFNAIRSRLANYVRRKRQMVIASPLW